MISPASAGPVVSMIWKLNRLSARPAVSWSAGSRLGMKVRRVTAADYVVGVSGGQLGNLEAGALGSLTSPAISALAGGLITIAGAAVIGLALPAFARYQRQPEADVAHPGQRQLKADVAHPGQRQAEAAVAHPGQRQGQRQRQRPEETAEQGADRRVVPVKPG